MKLNIRLIYNKKCFFTPSSGIGGLLLLLLISNTAIAQVKNPNNPLYNRERVGCICQDGKRSNAIGKGACSKNGGVKHWLYADVGIYQQYSQNLPAIPDNRLIRLTPEQVKNFLRVIETLPTIPKKRKNQDSPSEENDTEDKQGETEEEDEKALEKSKPKRINKNDCPCEDKKQAWNVSEFLFPFVLVLCIILLFVIIFYVIKKIIR